MGNILISHRTILRKGRSFDKLWELFRCSNLKVTVSFNVVKVHELIGHKYWSCSVFIDKLRSFCTITVSSSSPEMSSIWGSQASSVLISSLYSWSFSVFIVGLLSVVTLTLTWLWLSTVPLPLPLSGVPDALPFLFFFLGTNDLFSWSFLCLRSRVGIFSG